MVNSSISPFSLPSFGAFPCKEESKKEQCQLLLNLLQWALVQDAKDVSAKMLLKPGASLLF